MKMLLPLTLALPLALSGSIQAAVLLSDDFSSSTSGFGWAAGDSWDGGLANGGVTVGVANPQDVSRAFATPFDASATADKLYIAFDFTQAGNGQQWGGASFFDGNNAPSGGERFFMGDPGNIGNYGIDGYAGPSVNSTVPIASGVTMRLIAELDFNANGTQSTYNFWVGTSDLNAPTATATGGGPMLSISSMRLASDGNFGPITYDNLIVATTPGEVGLSAIPEPTSVALIGIAGAMLGFRRRRS